MLVAVDTGGTKTLVASFDKDGVLGHQIKFPTPQDQNEYITTLKKTITNHYSDKAVDAIVVAIPGVIKGGIVVECGNLPWKKFNITSALAGVLGKVPVFIENDAKQSKYLIGSGS